MGCLSVSPNPDSSENQIEFLYNAYTMLVAHYNCCIVVRAVMPAVCRTELLLFFTSMRHVRIESLNPRHTQFATCKRMYDKTFARDQLSIDTVSPFAFIHSDWRTNTNTCSCDLPYAALSAFDYYYKLNSGCWPPHVFQDMWRLFLTSKIQCLFSFVRSLPTIKLIINATVARQSKYFLSAAFRQNECHILLSLLNVHCFICFPLRAHFDIVVVVQNCQLFSFSYRSKRIHTHTHTVAL